MEGAEFHMRRENRPKSSRSGALTLDDQAIFLAYGSRIRLALDVAHSRLRSPDA